MAKKVFNMQGGLHSAAAFSALENRIYGSCVAKADSLVVTPGAGMNLNISSGDGLISVDAFSAKRIQVTATETAAVPAANASFNRIDTVVAYIDTAVAPTTAVIDNVNDVLKFKVVAGTAAATPAAPTSAAIQSSINAGNPYMVLYDVLVPKNAANVAGVTLTDRRNLPTSPAVADGIVTTSKLANLSVTTGKIAAKAITAAKIEDQQAWQTPTLLNGWVDFANGFDAVRYFKDSLGIVHLKGMVKSGTMGANVMVLPAGYRPAAVQYHASVSSGSVVGIVSIAGDGVVKFDQGSNGYISLSGITFRAEQ